MSVAVVCRTWLDRCFLGLLPWPETCHLLLLRLLLGAEYAAFSCVAALRHLQQHLLEAAAEEEHGEGGDGR